MTINSEVRKAGPFTGNDTTTVFPFTFKVFSADQVGVVLTNDSGNERYAVQGTEYTVTLNPDQNTSPGGLVQIPAPLATGDLLTITSHVPYLQHLDLTNQGGFYPATINQALDRATIQIQQLAEQVDRSVKTPVSSGSTPEALVNELLTGANVATAAAERAAESANFVASHAGNIATVASNIGPLTAVAGAMPDVATVAGGMADVAEVARVMPDVAAAANQMLLAAESSGPVFANTHAEMMATSYPDGTVIEVLTDETQDGVRTRYVKSGGTLVGPKLIMDYERTSHLSASSGAERIGFLQSGTGASPRTLRDKLLDAVSVRDFGAIGDGVTDDTQALQDAIRHVETNVQHGCSRLYIPTGRYKITQPLVISRQFVNIFGDGMWSSQIVFNGVSAGLKTNGQRYIRPHLSDFAIVGDSASGVALNLDIPSEPRGECYGGVLRNLYLQSGGKSLYAPFFFSMMVDTVWGYSHNDHVFVAACGPAVTWLNCYPLTSGPGKAGFRLRGVINMINCNGVNRADWWGIFGEDKTASDGYQNDFPNRAASDTPSILLIGCNIEEYSSLSSNGGAIMVHSIWRSFELQNCKIDRNNLNTPYEAIFKFRKPSNNPNQYAIIGLNALFAGGGTPALGSIYCAEGGSIYDKNGDLISASIKTWRHGNGLNYPILRSKALFDVYSDSALEYNALTARRFTVQTARYHTASLAQIGANQTVDVTGYSKVILTPAAASSVAKATFSRTIGGSDDYGRNGELIIEAGNDNLTIVHTARNSGVDTFVLAGEVNRTLLRGQIIRFLRSENTNQWQEI